MSLEMPDKCLCGECYDCREAYQRTVMPTVGMGATYSIGSDSYPCTVVAVSKTGHKITLARDDSKGRGYEPDGEFTGGRVFVPMTQAEIDQAWKRQQSQPGSYEDVFECFRGRDGRFQRRMGRTRCGFIHLGKRVHRIDRSF